MYIISLIASTTSSSSTSTSTTSSSSTSTSTTSSSSTSTTSSSSPILKTTTTKHIYPNGFILNAFPLNSTNNATIKIGLTDSIEFFPNLYSYDLNNIVDPLSLIFNYYCILSENDPGDFSNNLYLISARIPLSQIQINSASTCFKTNGTVLIFIFKLYNL